MSNYENIAKEVIQEDIDLLNDMANEEILAGLAMIQDDAMDEHYHYLIEKNGLDDLIKNVHDEVKELKKSLKA